MTRGLRRALRTAGVVHERDEPDALGRFVEVDHTLQEDFARIPELIARADSLASADATPAVPDPAAAWPAAWAPNST